MREDLERQSKTSTRIVFEVESEEFGIWALTCALKLQPATSRRLAVVVAAVVSEDGGGEGGGRVGVV
jgi:hypothetical protein